MKRPTIALLVPALLAFAAAAGAVAASASPEHDHHASSGESGRECFFPSQVSGFNNAGRDQIYVHTGPRDTYLFRTLGACPDLDFSERIGFDQRGGGTICRGIDVDLIVPSAIGPQRCPVAMIRKLAPGEKAQIDKAEREKAQ